MRCWSFVLLIACGGSTGPVAREPVGTIGIGLERAVSSRTWYRATTICGQGPYEIEVPVSNAKYGEDIVVSISTPRRVSMTAVVIADEVELRKAVATYDALGIGQGAAENTRCVADHEERLANLRAGGGGGGGGTTVPNVPTGTTITTTPPAPSTPPPLVVEEVEPPHAVEVLRFGWTEGEKPRQRVRLRLWSIEPNDLELVRFGITHVEWRPNVSEAEYQAYLVDRRRRAEAAAREASARVAAQPVVVVTEEDRARARADAERREREAAARERDDERRERKRQLDAAIAEENRRRREAYCASHPESRDCWGVGGKARWAQFEDLARQRTTYCGTHADDARCWSASERATREAAWRTRVQVALEPKLPDGPPPSPLDETPPPKLSENAEWRAGYWQWTGTTWLWLAGMWRVPDEDIVAERTTTAPDAPPPPVAEPIPPPPMTTTIWVTGFWQWSGSQWVWVPGAYRLRPEAGMTWRPTEWRARGRVHVLVPGGWVRGGRR